MNGYVHSIETFGTVDGPGIRFVIFLQGCPMQCKYCHNPDTWALNCGTQMSTEKLLEDYSQYEAFLRGGGITVTGGEPLMQIDFLIELFEKAKQRKIHTCIDTSGITFQIDNSSVLEKFERLLKVTDLVLLDIKHIDATAHKDLTGHSNENILSFAKYLEEKKVPVWIRHVVVPTITMNEESLHKLGYFLGDLSNIKALDVLPYHDLGKTKYESLGMKYPLRDLPSLEKSDAMKAREIILNGMKQRLKEKKQTK